MNDVMQGILGMSKMVDTMGNSMVKGQQIEENRMYLEDEKNVKNAYEHIAKSIGQNGNMSILDNDPIVNSRAGTMALGKYMSERASSSQNRLATLKNMNAYNDEHYQKNFRPLAIAAMDAYEKGDMVAFGQNAGALSQTAPFPYTYEMGQDGNFTENFRSSKHGDFVPTGQKITAEQVMQNIQNMMQGEQKILRGIDMQTHPVNVPFLEAASKFRMSTHLDNANNLADGNKWIPMQKGNQIVYAIPQNRHDDYSTKPSYKVLDEKSNRSYMASMQELTDNGFIRSDVATQAAQRKKIQAPKGQGDDSQKQFADAFNMTALNAGYIYDKDQNHYYKFVENYEEQVPDYKQPMSVDAYNEITSSVLSTLKQNQGNSHSRGGANDPLGLLNNQ